MKIKCVSRRISSEMGVAVFERLKTSIKIDGDISELILGKEYSVAAIEERKTGIWVFINTVSHSDYPYPYPIELFEIADSRIPEKWSVVFKNSEDGASFKRMSFSEWAHDDFFYEHLVDGLPEAVEIYKYHFSNS